VVANAVAALSEISDVSSSAAEALELNSQTVNKLCTALNECTEYVITLSTLNECSVMPSWFHFNDSIYVCSIE
jgi:Asp-tRNA(Asn)/Glu-tRNA(Gln) amidotransferase C subunit